MRPNSVKKPLALVFASTLLLFSVVAMTTSCDDDDLKVFPSGLLPGFVCCAHEPACSIDDRACTGDADCPPFPQECDVANSTCTLDGRVCLVDADCAILPQTCASGAYDMKLKPQPGSCPTTPCPDLGFVECTCPLASPADAWCTVGACSLDDQPCVNTADCSQSGGAQTCITDLPYGCFFR